MQPNAPDNNNDVARNESQADAVRPNLNLVNYDDNPDYESYHPPEASEPGDDEMNEVQARQVSADRQERQSLIEEYARVASEHFSAHNFPYPDRPDAPRYDDNMVPHYPELVDGQYKRPAPLGRIDRLPPVQGEGSVQTHDAVNRAPSAYLKSDLEQQKVVMVGLIKNLFNEVSEDDCNDMHETLTQGLRIVQALRSELTTTKCHMKSVKSGSIAKKQLFSLQSHQNAVDSDRTQFMTRQWYETFVNQISTQWSTNDLSRILRESATNAIEMMSRSDNNALIIQEEYSLSDFNGQVPSSCIPDQFYELRGYQASQYCNGVKQYSVMEIAKEPSRWCKSFINGDSDARPDCTTAMLNCMISGQTSRRGHLLQNIQFQGALVTSMILKDPDHIAPKLGWLRKTLMFQGGLNLATLLQVDLAGSHKFGRDNSQADFSRKISQIGGFVRVVPLLVMNKEDKTVHQLLQNPKSKRAKPKTGNQTEADLSAQAESSGQRSSVGPGGPPVHTSMYTHFLKALTTTLTILDEKADDLINNPATSVFGKTLKEQQYGVQEIWQRRAGDLVVNNSMVKLGTRKNKKVVLYNELSTLHHPNSTSPCHVEAMASPPTLDTDFHNCDLELFNNEQYNSKAWVKQIAKLNLNRNREGYNADQLEFVEYCSRYDEQVNVLPLLRLQKKLRDDPVYGKSFMSLANDFTLIRIQVFTVAVHNPLSNGDAYLRQANLILSNSEAARHLMTFKNEKIVAFAQKLIARVRDFDELKANPITLHGSRERLQDLNRNLFMLIQQQRERQIQRQSAVQSPQADRHRLQPSEVQRPSSIDEVTQNIASILQECSVEKKAILLDLITRQALLTDEARHLYEQHFTSAFRIAVEEVSTLPCFLFRSPSEINADPQGTMYKYSEQWSLSPVPLLLQPEQFNQMLSLLQQEGSDSVYEKNKIHRCYVQEDDFQSCELIVKGLARALIMYLQMYQDFDEKHLRSASFLANLLSNFARGVLGLRFYMDFERAIVRCDIDIRRFVGGLFSQNSVARRFTRETVQEFREHYRESIYDAYRRSEHKYYQSKDKNRDARLRAQQAEALNYPHQEPYRPSSSPSQIGIQQPQLSINQPSADDRLQSQLASPLPHMLMGNLFDSTPQLRMHGLATHPRGHMHDTLQTPDMLSRLDLTNQPVTSHQLRSQSPAQYASHSHNGLNDSGTPVLHLQPASNMPGGPPVQASEVVDQAPQQEQQLRKSTRNQGNSQSTKQANAQSLSQSIARTNEKTTAAKKTTTRVHDTPNPDEETKEESATHLGKREQRVHQNAAQVTSGEKRKRDDKKDDKKDDKRTRK